MTAVSTAAEVKVQITGQESVKELNTLIKQNNNLMEAARAAYGENSDEYALAKQKLDAVTKALEGVNAEAKDLGDKNLKKVTNETKNVKNGFDAVGKAGQVFEQFGGNIGHVGSAMGRVSDAADLFSSKLRIFKSFKTSILSAASAFKGNMVAALGKARVAALAFMGALGIGILIAGVSLLVTYWKEISVFLGLSASDSEKLEKSSQKIADKALERLNTTKGMTEQLRLQGLTEREILQKKQDETKEAIKQRLIAINLAEFNLREQVRLETRNKQILVGILNFINAPIQAILKTMDLLSKAVGRDSNLAQGMNDWIASFVADPDKTKKEGQKAIDEQKKSLEGLKEEFAKYENTKNAQDQKAADNAKKLRDKNAADAAAAQKKIDDAKLAAQEKARDEANNIAAKAARTKKERETDEFELKLQDAEAKFLKEKELLEAQGLETITLQQNFDAEIEQIAIDKNDRLNKIEADAAAKRAAKKKEQDDADLKETERIANAKIQIEQNAFKAAQAFSGLMAEIGKDNLETQKAQALFQVGIDTASAISSVVNSSAALAGNPVALGFNIAAGIAIVLRNMKKATSILNAQVPVPGGDNGGGGGNNDNPQPDIQANPRDNRVFVLETDITTAQQRINNLNKIGIID
jgi:hypothetical protein